MAIPETLKELPRVAASIKKPIVPNCPSEKFGVGDAHSVGKKPRSGLGLELELEAKI